MKQIQIILIAIGLVVASSASAQQTMDINTILDSVRYNYPGLKAFDASEEASKATVAGARSWMAPEVGAGFFMTPYNVSTWNKNGGAGSFMVSLQQMFPNKKELDANHHYLNSLSAIDRDNKNVLLNDLYAVAKSNYYDWVIDEKKLKVLDENEKILNVLIKVAEVRYKNNQGKLNAYYKAQAALGDIDKMRVELRNDIVQKRIRLNILMHKKGAEVFQIDTAFEIKSYQPQTADYFTQNKSDVQQVIDNINSTLLQKDLEQTKLKPQFGLRYDHMVGFGNQPMQYSLMAMVKLPFVNWASKSFKANIKSLEWKAKSLELQKETIISENVGQSNSVLANMVTQKHHLMLYNTNIIPALRKNYDALLISYEQNTGDLFEVLDAWDGLNMTQMKYLDALQELLRSQTEYEKVIEQK